MINEKVFKSALFAIPAGPGFEDWMRVAMAIKAEYGEQGLPLLHMWSATWSGYKEKKVNEAWRGLKPHSITGGTVFFMARQHGWTPDKDVGMPGPPSREEMDKQRQAQKARDLEYEAAATQARVALSLARLDTHPYLAAKGFPDTVIPVMQEDFKVPSRTRDGKPWHRNLKGHLLVGVRHHEHDGFVSLQDIDKLGRKRFARGGRMAGGYYQMGRSRRMAVLVEGLATGLSVLSAMRMLEQDCSVYVCFFDSNLRRIAPRLHQRQRFVVADNDKSNAGKDAARATGLSYWMPGHPGMDANDYHARFGLPTLAEQLRGFLNNAFA